LNQIAEKFGWDIVYAFGSKSKGLVEWLDRIRFGPSISPLSDVDIGVMPCPVMPLSIKEKVHLGMALEDLFSTQGRLGSYSGSGFLAADTLRGERVCYRVEHRADEYELEGRRSGSAGAGKDFSHMEND